MKKGLIFVIVLTMLISSSLIGCSGKTDNSSNAATPSNNATATSNDTTVVTEPAKDVNLNFTMRSAPETVAFKKLAEMYTAQYPNVKIAINEVGSDGYFTRITSELFAKSKGIDIVNFTNVELGMFAASGVIENLTPYLDNSNLNLNGFNKDMFVKAALESSTYDGNVYALPYGISCLLLYYRTDLIKTPPQDWDEYLALEKQFTKSINPNSPTEYGGVMMAKRGQMAPKVFSAFLRSYGGEFDPENINNQGAVDALTLWVDEFANLKVVPPDSNATDYSKGVQTFQEGLSAMALQQDAAAGTFADQTKSPKIFDKFAVTTIPGKKQADGSIKKVTYTQSWAFAINSFSENKEEAYKFLTFFNNPENYSKAMGSSDSTALKDVINSDAFKNSHKSNYDAYVNSFEFAKAFPTNKYTSDFFNILDFDISKALAKELTPKQALDEASAEMTKAMKE